MSPRNGSGIYSQPFDDVDPDTTVESTVYNGFTRDVETDLNTPRPIIAGGTGASSADGALAALSAEKAGQQVTNYNDHVWMSGSFWSSGTSGIPGAPIDAISFVGIAYVRDANNIIVEARDRGSAAIPGKKYIREKRGGVWSAWVADPTPADLALKVAKAGDTLTGGLVYGPASQYNAAFSARKDLGASFEFGHSNTAGYGSVLGQHQGGGQPYLALNAGPGTTSNTFKTLGIKGSVILSDVAGGFIFGTVPVASADNQALTALLTLNTTGNIGVNGASPRTYTKISMGSYIGADGGATHLSIYDNGVSSINNYGFGVNGGSLNSNVPASGGFNFNVNGVSKVNFSQTGDIYCGGINVATSSTARITCTGTGSQPAIFGRGEVIAYPGVYGASINSNGYGKVGIYDNSAYWCFTGTPSAIITGGTWQTSDARLKTVTRNVDSADALAAVNAIAVKEFKPANEAAAFIIYGGADDPVQETRYGWLAQDIEPIIPIAVRTIVADRDDRHLRAALARRKVPKADTEEAVALGEENITVKIMNDHYMLSTLWAAVQQLSQQNDELRAEINALKGTVQ